MLCLSMLLTFFFVSVMLSLSAEDPEAFVGPYTIEMASYPLNSDIQNPEEDKVTVFFPTGVTSGSNVTFTDSTSFKFISYAHGMFGGGIANVPAYYELLTAMASFGFIIGATHQCDIGCFDDCNSLRHDPPCFGNYYKKQLAVFDWAKAFVSEERAADPFSHVDWSAGVGIAGHSMGGQATLFSSSADNAAAYDIRAAVLHHAFTHTFPAPAVPFLDFTGEKDSTAPADTMGVPIYESADGLNMAKGLVDKTNAGHHEPDITSLDKNGIQLIAQFSAAWFKLYLDQTPVDFGIDFNGMIYGTGVSGVCAGGDGEMTTCTIDQKL